MPILHYPTVGVLFAGGAVHVTALRRGRHYYTAEPLVEHGLAGQRQALQQACQRLGIGRAQAVMAVPEALIHRCTIRLPRHRRRSEREALTRLLIRRQLPAPVSAWHYCLTADEGSRTRARLTATRQSSLRAIKSLTAGSGLTIKAALATRDALRTSKGRASLPAELPRTPAARLSRALILAAQNKGAVNLLNARSPLCPANAVAPRALAITLAGALGCLALYSHLQGTAGLDLASAGATEHPATAFPIASATGSGNLDPEHQDPATSATVHDTGPILDPIHLEADARRRTLLDWIDRLANSRPPKLWLQEARLNGSRLSLHAQARSDTQGYEYIARLNQAGITEARLERIEQDNTGLGLWISAISRIEPAEPALPPTHPSTQPLSHQSAALAQLAQEHGLALVQLHQGTYSQTESLRLSPLHLQLSGDYAAIRTWLAALSTIEQLLGIESVWLRRAADRRLKIDLEMTLFSASVSK